MELDGIFIVAEVHQIILATVVVVVLVIGLQETVVLEDQEYSSSLTILHKKQPAEPSQLQVEKQFIPLHHQIHL
jgi:hypothetical protein